MDSNDNTLSTPSQEFWSVSSRCTVLQTPCPRGYSFLSIFLFSISHQSLTCPPCFQSLFYIYRDLSLATCSIFSLLLGGGLYLSTYLDPSSIPLLFIPFPTPLCSILFYFLTIPLCLGTRLRQPLSHKLLLEAVV